MNTEPKAVSWDVSHRPSSRDRRVLEKGCEQRVPAAVRDRRDGETLAFCNHEFSFSAQAPGGFGFNSQRQFPATPAGSGESLALTGCAAGSETGSLSPSTCSEGVSVSSWQMKRQKLKEVSELVQGRTPWKWQAGL